jgi:hypothetical protein
LSPAHVKPADSTGVFADSALLNIQIGGVLYKALGVLSVSQPVQTGRIPPLPRTGIATKYDFSGVDTKIIRKIFSGPKSDV